MDKSDLILEKLDSMNTDIKRMDTNIKRMDTDIKRIDTDIKRMDTDIKSIKLTLENEVRTNIMRVAEGHLDLSRSLNEALKTNNEFEMLTIKVNMLESDVKELKRIIS